MAKSKPLTQEQAEDSRRLKALWEEKKPMTQEAFAEAYGLGTQGNVTQYLNGHIPLNLEAAIRFAGGLSVPVETISPRLAKVLAMAKSSERHLPSQVEILVERVMALADVQRQEFLSAVLPILGSAMDSNHVSSRFMLGKLSGLKVVGNDRVAEKFGTPAKPQKKAKKSHGRPPDAQLDDYPEK